MRRLLHGITAAVGLLVIGVGVPALLAQVAGWPLPTKPPNWNNVYWAARQNHAPAEFVIKTLAVVAWLAWAQLMWALLWELAVNVPRTLRGERSVAAPLSLGVMSRAARGLVAPLMLLTTFMSSTPSVAAPALADLTSSAWPGAGLRAAAATVTHLDRRPVEAPLWLIAPGDTLWDVAERCLGDGSRVDEVLACNAGLTATSRLRPGDSLRLPVEATVPASRTPHTDVRVVEPGDTLWEIADDELDDPLRWSDVYAANEGRTFADGRRLDDPNLILPGWDLTIPADNTAPVQADPVDVPELAAPTELEVEEAVDAADITATPVPASAPVTTAPMAEPAEAGAPRGTAAPVIAAPVTTAPMVEPAEAGVPRSTAAPVTTASVTTAPMVEPADAGAPYATAPPAAGAAETTLPAAEPTGTALPLPTQPPPVGPVDPPVARPVDPDTRPVNRWSDAVGPAGPAHELPVRSSSGDAPSTTELLTMERAAMMSAGLLLLLGVRRRQRLRTAPAGARPSATPLAAAATERTLRSIAAGERFARVDLAIRASALGLVRAGQRALAVLVAPDGAIEIVATGSVDLPAPWEGAGARWTLPASVPIELLAPEARQVGGPTPALVQLGCDGAADVYVDLEALGALEIAAPAEQADAIVTALATTLATSVLAEVTTLIGVEVPASAFCGHRHHVSASDVPDALAAAVDAVGSTVSAATTTFALRARATGGETWEPAVVLVGSAVGEAGLAFVPSGVAVVSAAPIVGPSSVLAPDGDAWVLRPAGIRVTPIGLHDGELAAVAQLLDVPEPAPTDPLDELDAAASPAAPDHSPPEHALLVRLIGPVRVETADGDPVEFERSKTRELVAWLATHRERATRTLARTALWELDVRDATFANVVSEARRALARAVLPPDGEEWVARTMTEDLPLHELVRTDADLITAALAAARLAPPAAAIATLRPAVELLAGMPFEGTSYLWPDAEGITSSLVVLATSAAAELAAQCLAVGDAEGVFAATDRGLRVLPGHEELIGLRMRAHARSGDRAGVRHEWESYSRTLLADPWSDGEPSPKLVALRADLLG